MVGVIFMNILIIGFGSIGKRHQKVLNTLYPEARIDVVSAHASPAKAFYKDISEVAELDSYDYFIIASQTVDHFKQLSALDASVYGKPILVEKPLFSELRKFDSDRNRIYVGYNLRYHPLISVLRTLCSSHKFITVNIIVGHYLPDWRSGDDYRNSYSSSRKRGGGVLLDLSHEIDYVQWLFGSIKTVKAIGGKISPLEIDTEDFVAFIGETDRGVRFTISLDYISRIPIRQIYANAEDLSCIFNLITGSVHLSDNSGDSNNALSSNVNRDFTYSTMHADILETASIACTLKEGLGTLGTIDMIRTSIGDLFYE